MNGGRLISAKLTKLRFETAPSFGVFTPNLCNLWRNGSLLNIFPEKCLSGRTGRAGKVSEINEGWSKMVDAKRAFSSLQESPSLERSYVSDVRILI